MTATADREAGSARANPAAFVETLRQARDAATGHRQRALLNVALAHVVAEVIDHDIDRLMATMVDEPSHEFYGMPGLAHLVGYDAVRSYYLRTFSDAGPDRGAMEIERFVIGEDAIVKVGTVVYSGRGLAVRAPEIAAKLGLSPLSVIRKRMCLVMPFVDGRIQAEQHFFDGAFRREDVFEPTAGVQ